MQLQIRSLVPIPLRDKVAMRRSDIWDRELNAQSPEYLFIKAPSGTGKTTLIHSLYGIRSDYQGSICWDGKNIKDENPEYLALLRSGGLSVIFQDMRLFPSLSTWDNLELKRSLSNIIPAEELISWMERLGIADKKNAVAATLSYGEQQRVAIIRSLLQPFRWLLMDEPFSHLDHDNTAKAAALVLEQVQRHQAGMILADLDDNNFFPYHKTLLL